MATYKERAEGGIGLAQPTDHHDLLVTTAFDFPGYEIVKVYGVVYGLTVRSRNIGASIGAGLKSLVGGELKPMTKNVVSSRDQALDRMVAGARELGANAVYAFRFDGGAIGEGWTEICCYGTAATIVPKGTSKPSAPPQQ
uniref:ARAD1C21604p n=1 Tax=Blastobotrys adeninivorans TaxID=409370 RepID=A0A060T7G1_BLAAD